MAGIQGNTEKVDVDYSAIPVPYDARMPKGALTMAWWAMCSAMFWLVVAATLAVNFGTQNALLGLALSAIVYSLVNAVIVRFAIRTGLSVALFSPILFGEAGAAIATVIFFATAIYYGVFEGSVIAVAIHSFVPAISLTLMYLIVVSYSVLLIFGECPTLAGQVKRRTSAVLPGRAFWRSRRRHSKNGVDLDLATHGSEFRRRERDRNVEQLYLLDGCMDRHDVYI